MAEPGWLWHNADKVITGRTWGGNLEILHWNLAANRWIRPVEDYAGCVPAAGDLRGDAPRRRGLQDAAQHRRTRTPLPVPRHRPRQAQSLGPRGRPTRADAGAFRADQNAAVLRAVSEYSTDALVVCSPDFGHTDPQQVLPYGGQIKINGPVQRITVTY